MCPSYRITRDEKHLTRGRANTLRLALSGQLGAAGLAGPEVKEALDLCVSCKGCKRDCPTGVDMAKIKIEARAAWSKKHGLRLRERLFAFLPAYAPYASRIGALLAQAERIPLLSGWAKNAIGLASQRSLPRFRKSFLSGATAPTTTTTTTPAAAHAGKEVLLFVDTFNNYMEPENAAAAQQVLAAAGYRVHLNTVPGGRPLCCGRTYLAAGLVEQAKAEARRSLDALMPFVERGVPVVGLEPSCLLTLRDEFLSYGYGEEAEKLSRSAYLLEEFLVKEKQEGRCTLDLKPLPAQQVFLHGHCHQKAFDAFTPVQTALQWIPGIDLSVIESSCCGMAGSFGYEAEHYEASLAMAELSLLPSVRKAVAKAGKDAIIVADGTSCRHQIHDGTASRALHVAKVLALALNGKPAI
jgi:Fe-S oxidoreductase